MSKVAMISNKAQAESNWTGTQAYMLAVCCLLLGVALGYLFRGTASPAQPSSPAIANLPQPMGGGMGEPSPEQAKAAVDKAATEKIAQKTATETPPAAKPSAEKPAAEKASAGDKQTIEIELLNGRKLRFDANIDPAVLARLIAAIDK